ncbi:MAG: glycosyltransferase [Oscillospiraceae bacterium]|nr:glycosyltransferase [Oscillospiraceae bacterium]
MPKLSLIIPTRNAEEHLHEALECLITQSNDDFEVILLDCMSTDGTTAIIDEFCEEYVDFRRVDFPSENTNAAMNKGLELAKGDYVWFYAPDGRVTDQTVGAFLETAEAKDADVVAGRIWYFGDFEPYYDIYADTTTVLPKFDKYERSILWDSELSNKIFRRHILVARNLTVPENLYEAGGILNLRALLGGLSFTGCPAAVYQRREQRGLEGFSPHLVPSLENAKVWVARMQEVFSIIEAEIKKDTGSLDGDEAFLQEAVYRTVSVLLNRFYRYFWHMDQETLTFVTEAFETHVQLLIPERFKKLKDAHPDIPLPNLVGNLQQAAENPAFSMLLDIADNEELPPLLNSLYMQTFPFFEVFARQSQYDSLFFPERWKTVPNLHVLPDEGFHNLARSEARSRVSINLRDGKPIDPRVLQKVHYAAVPLFAKPFFFNQTKNSFKVKRTLKEKGLNIT